MEKPGAKTFYDWWALTMVNRKLSYKHLKYWWTCIEIQHKIEFSGVFNLVCRWIWLKHVYFTFQFEQFVVHEVHDAFEFDGLVTSHPIYVPVNNPDEINEIFDRISYAKARWCIILPSMVETKDVKLKWNTNLMKSRKSFLMSAYLMLMSKWICCSAHLSYLFLRLLINVHQYFKTFEVYH